MVTSKATSVEAYIAELPEERRKAIQAVRRVIQAHLPRGLEEGMQYGMIGYYVPLDRYGPTYNGQPLGVAALASRKGYMSLYLSSVYSDPKQQRWFVDEYRRSGKKLDMGKSCVRFKSLDDLPLELVGEVIARTSVDDFIALYERQRSAQRETSGTKPPKNAAAGKPRKGAAAGRSPTKRTATRRASGTRP
ncbi:MAG: DUF1801 domain-containing protein [Myxococcaceae bacterium]|nr:DUF1801 domain-containing protein [Myxococcaceae bacterium]MCI0672230.1 DUF1801 domain-containing protein [Myxococcaceae bacterium]